MVDVICLAKIPSFRQTVYSICKGMLERCGIVGIPPEHHSIDGTEVLLDI